MGSWTGRRMPDLGGTRTGPVKPLGKQSEVKPRIGDILDIPPTELATAVAVVCAAGCALLISPTSDGGALSVTLYAADQRHRCYVTSSSAFSEALLAARDVSEAHMIGGPAKKQNGPLRAT